MAITKDQVYGLDVAWFGQPFVQATAAAIGDNSTLDVCFYAEPFTVSYAQTAPITFQASKMFLLF